MPQIMGTKEEAGGAPAAAEQTHRRGSEWQEDNWEWLVRAFCFSSDLEVSSCKVIAHPQPPEFWVSFIWLIKTLRYLCSDFYLVPRSSVPPCRGSPDTSEYTCGAPCLSEALPWTQKENIYLKSPCAFSKQCHLSLQSLRACVFLHAHLMYG